MGYSKKVDEKWQAKWKSEELYKFDDILMLLILYILLCITFLDLIIINAYIFISILNFKHCSYISINESMHRSIYKYEIIF